RLFQAQFTLRLQSQETLLALRVTGVLFLRVSETTSVSLSAVSVVRERRRRLFQAQFTLRLQSQETLLALRVTRVPFPSRPENSARPDGGSLHRIVSVGT
ncbi:MAG: hypothetical protein NTZ35_03005, partial [Ignavibacteriales bacterium]|nr:hypothetical protein [Ignavibacteriales bacterium]